MRELVIPDVHEDIDQVEKILAHAGPVDHTYFLGDFMDTHKPLPNCVRRTAKWLEDNIQDPDKTFHWGNHDLGYAYARIPGLRCSGFDAFKITIVSSAMELARKHFRFTSYVQGYQLSHAGFAADLAESYVDPQGKFEEAKAQLCQGVLPPLLRVGYSRGGDSPTGGVTWLDWDDEFEPVPALTQIVGHTRHKEPQWKDDNLALDTGLHHYALIEDGKVTTVEV